MTTKILVGDCRTILPTLDAASVHCVVTSPPYFGLRDYGTSQWDGGEPECDHLGEPFRTSANINRNWDGGKDVKNAGNRQPFGAICGKCGATRIDKQIGLEPTVDAFVDEMVAVFREVRRVLKDDGTLWLNLGDSYVAPRGNTSAKPGFDNKATAGGADLHFAGTRPHDGLKTKDLIGIPWRVAFALQADGWYLRQDIIWAKPNPMPESVTDRCTKSHEYLFLLTKSPRYHFDAKAIAEPTAWDFSTSKMPDGWDTGEGAHGSFHRNGREKGAPASHKGSNFNQGKTAIHQDGRASDGTRSDVGTRNKRSVWTISTQAFPDAHFATFPEKLVEPCILAGSREGDTILDPFAGSGTTVGVANRLGRHGIAIELNPEYRHMIERRTAQQALEMVS